MSRPHQCSEKYTAGGQDFQRVGKTHIAEYHQHTGVRVGRDRQSVTAGRRYTATKELVQGLIPVVHQREPWTKPVTEIFLSTYPISSHGCIFLLNYPHINYELREKGSFTVFLHSWVGS